VPELLVDGTNAYIYDGGLAPQEQVNLATGTNTYLVTDSLGSVRGTVSNSGALTGTTSYNAWGNPATTGGLTATTPFGFAGGYTDPDSLIYLLNRYYQPSTGQFISADPDISQTLQPYEYANDNPASLLDPLGAKWELHANYWWWTYWEAVYPSGWLWNRVKETIGGILEIAPASLQIESMDKSYHVHEEDYRWVGAGSGCDPYERCGKHWYTLEWWYPYYRTVVGVHIFWWTLYHQTVTFDAAWLIGYDFYIYSG
jgi:RHS repeat-associated protein